MIYTNSLFARTKGPTRPAAQFSDCLQVPAMSASAYAFRSVLVLGVLVSARPSSAQTSTSTTTWEARVTSGALVPTGDQRSSLKNAGTTAAQVSWMLRPSLGLTGTFAWSRSRDVSMLAQPKLDVFSSDLGLEARLG